MSSAAAHKRVQVCIRVRPPVLSKPGTSSSPAAPLPTTSSGSSSSVVVNDTEHTISVVTNAATGAGTCFHFDHVLPAQTTQAGVYDAAASQIVDSVLRGYNGTILAYGQTGAGKTFTMSGGKRHFDERGICARAISSIFQQIQRDADHAFVVRVSYVEVYNETLLDLLHFQEPTARHYSSHQNQNQNQNQNQSNQNNPSKEELVIQENKKGQTFVRGLLRPVVATEEQAFDLLFQGETNRTIAEHCLNASSTRSHCIFTVYVERHAHADADLGMDATDADGSSSFTSKLHLVDLAGSERMKKTNVSGVMLKEASHINKSLTFLEQVVIALGDKKRQHIPYRQTPLTNLLKDSLGGNCKTMLVACVWPEPSHDDQTVATLKFATRMMRVKTSAIVNVAGGGAGGVGGGGGGAVDAAEIQKYVAEIRRLKEELAMHDVLSGRSGVAYDLKTVRSASARATCRAQIHAFIRDASARPPVQTLGQIDTLLSVFRELYVESHAQQQLHTTSVSSVAPPAVPTQVLALATGAESRMVKQFRALRGSSPPSSSSFALPSSSQQQQLPTLPLVRSSTSSLTQHLHQQQHRHETNPEEEEEEEEEERNGKGDTRTKLPLLIRPGDQLQNQQQHPQPVITQQRSEKELFDAFKQLRDPRPESLLDLELSKQNLRTAKSQMSSLGLEVNKLKLAIDGFTLQLQDARPRSGDADTRSDGGDSVSVAAADPAIEFLVRQLKDAKKQYRDSFERFQHKRNEVNYLLKIKEQMLQNLTREFEVWRATQA